MKAQKALPARGVVAIAVLPANEDIVVGMRPVEVRVIETDSEFVIAQRFDKGSHQIASSRRFIDDVEIAQRSMP